MVVISKIFPERGYGFTQEGYIFFFDDLATAKGEVPAIDMVIHEAKELSGNGKYIRIGGTLPREWNRLKAHNYAAINYYKAVDMYTSNNRMYSYTLILSAFKRLDKKITSSGIEFLLPDGFEIALLSKDQLQQISSQLNDPTLFMHKQRVICRKLRS